MAGKIADIDVRDPVRQHAMRHEGETSVGVLDGKVAIVTGAGRGIGRAEALLLASEGAAVVVNDLGAATDGAGSDASAAQQVVDEITKTGGQAVADYGSVMRWGDAEAMVQRAVDTFGGLDAVINN